MKPTMSSGREAGVALQTDHQRRSVSIGLKNLWQILVSSFMRFPRKCAESSLNLIVVTMNPNSPGTTWKDIELQCGPTHARFCSVRKRREGSRKEGFLLSLQT